jgi:hypothetical protein
MSSVYEVGLLLRKGIAAARSGRAPAARSILKQVVQTDPDNEMAWLWLSGLVATNDQKRFCLEQVLRTNPKNMYARAGLMRLQDAITEKELLEARLSMVGFGNGNGSLAWSPLPDLRPTDVAERPSPLQEAEQIASAGLTEIGDSAGPLSERETLCPSCDEPLPITAIYCPHCLLTFDAFDERSGSGAKRRSSTSGSSLASRCRHFLSRLINHK